VVVDRLTKYKVLVPCHDMSGQSTLDMLNENVFKTFGLPSDMVSDRGPQFVSQIWDLAMKKLGTKSKLSTAFHPQTDECALIPQLQQIRELIRHPNRTNESVPLLQLQSILDKLVECL
jgi:hypothetical protein